MGGFVYDYADRLEERADLRFSVEEALRAGVDPTPLLQGETLQHLLGGRRLRALLAEIVKEAQTTEGETES